MAKLLLLLIISAFGIVASQQNGNLSSFKLKYMEDAFLLTPELIKKYGYKSEVYAVETEDGYLLEMHRIPKPGAQPVLLMHGLLDSSSSWILMGPKQGLAYLLSNLGYDVWMGNARGNRYSKKHRTLSPSSLEFWQFSFHEIGKYDLPALIDFVLKKTNFKKLQYIGHSQGTCVFWILCSERPEYNNKIISMQALGPVAYVSHSNSPVVKVLKPFVNSLSTLLKIIGLKEFWPNSDFFTLFSDRYCKDGEFVQIICKNFMFLLSGYNDKELNSTMLPVIAGHTPAGSSTRQIIHFLQIAKSGHFRQYDHGFLKNLITYKRFTPPDYNLPNVKAKVILHHSNNDWLTAPEDVELLYKQLPNVIGNYLVSDKEYDHLDFIWGIHARELLYNKIVKIMKDVERNEV